ncbi:DUF4236 domain-containing protein [Vibrio europaeus]|uniref:DUF4236 domain-containing protein n=1 Tax=Vibrio europaeus TaxID=300876 RepID=UPI003AA9BB68
MKVQFRKRIRVLPFLWLNMGKKGLSSISLGAPGLSLTLKLRSAFLTVGATGTGLSVRSQLWGKKPQDKAEAQSLEVK